MNVSKRDWLPMKSSCEVLGHVDDSHDGQHVLDDFELEKLADFNLLSIDASNKKDSL